MMFKKYLQKDILIYVIKFLIVFAIFYYGTVAIIGLSSPAGHYSLFVDKYLNYITGFRKGLLLGAKFLLKLAGYETYLANEFVLRLQNGKGVRMVYSCLGYGIMSFWAAFVIANKGDLIKKAAWILMGLFLICLINVLRICLLLLSNNKVLAIPFHINHHTLFNVSAYLLIFILIWLYDKSFTKKHR